MFYHVVAVLNIMQTTNRADVYCTTWLKTETIQQELHKAPVMLSNSVHMDNFFTRRKGEIKLNYLNLQQSQLLNFELNKL